MQEASEPGAASDRAELLARAREQYRRGSVGDAWDTCARVVELSRQTDDPATMADAATVIRTMANATMTRRVHALCVEVLARLGNSDPVRQARVRAQLAATSDPFLAEDGQLEAWPETDDVEAFFLQLQARHADLLGVAHINERLVLAEAAIELGTSTGVNEYVCWGRRWRMDAYAVLGNRVDLISELAALRPLVEELGQSSWRSLLLLIDASQRLLEGRFAEASALSEEAARLGGPDSEPGYFRLVMASAIAELTGRYIEAIEAQVRAAVDGLPYLARSWLCVVLKAGGQREEAAALWRSIAPHVGRMPERAAEWLIATVGHAEMCVWLGDVETARVLYDKLLPYGDLQATAYASSPYNGPVAYPLGRLATLLGNPEQARQHLRRALTSAEELHALPYLALIHAALASVDCAGSKSGRQHAEAALRISRRVGMPPTATEMESFLSGSADPAGGLTPRELEIAGLVAGGLSNAGIGRRLTLSERTVENHVSHILRKLDCSSRAGVATWYAHHRGLE